jgi:hypothetical protein
MNWNNNLNHWNNDLGPLCKLRDWIDIKLLKVGHGFYSELSYNQNAVYMLRKYPSQINFTCLVQNCNRIYLADLYDTLRFSCCDMELNKPYYYNNTRMVMSNIDVDSFYIKKLISWNEHAIHWLEQNQDKIIWTGLSSNPNAIPILEQNLDKIDWYFLSLNPNAIQLLEQNPDKIVWGCLSRNPNAIHLLEQNPDKIDWCWLSRNPNAIPLLEQNPDKINWYALSRNPNAIHLLEQNPDKIDWYNLSSNPNAIHLLEKNPDKINWERIAGNPAIFQYDYEAMRLRMRPLAEDLMADRFHPRNFNKWLGWGFDEFNDIEF